MTTFKKSEDGREVSDVAAWAPCLTEADPPPGLFLHSTLNGTFRKAGICTPFTFVPNLPTMDPAADNPRNRHEVGVLSSGPCPLAGARPNRRLHELRNPRIVWILLLRQLHRIATAALGRRHTHGRTGEPDAGRQLLLERDDLMATRRRGVFLRAGRDWLGRRLRASLAVLEQLNVA